MTLSIHRALVCSLTCTLLAGASLYSTPDIFDRARAATGQLMSSNMDNRQKQLTGTIKAIKRSQSSDEQVGTVAAARSKLAEFLGWLQSCKTLSEEQKTRGAQIGRNAQREIDKAQAAPLPLSRSTPASDSALTPRSHSASPISVDQEAAGDHGASDDGRDPVNFDLLEHLCSSIEAAGVRNAPVDIINQLGTEIERAQQLAGSLPLPDRARLTAIDMRYQVALVGAAAADGADMAAALASHISAEGIYEFASADAPAVQGPVMQEPVAQPIIASPEMVPAVDQNVGALAAHNPAADQLQVARAQNWWHSWGRKTMWVALPIVGIIVAALFGKSHNSWVLRNQKRQQRAPITRRVQ